MASRFKPPIVPAAFFGIVLGLAGLGGAWRTAHQVWNLPAVVGEVLMAMAAIVWAICPPIVPAPTTAALNTNMLSLSSDWRPTRPAGA